MRQEPWEGNIIPAQLSFLAIYSPPLGTTDETFKNQVVFYYSREEREARFLKKKASSTNADQDELAAREVQNEKLRTIGLAQGMVDFARSFSNGKAVDSVDTEKSRIILHELERGWWVLASIDLTRISSTVRSTGSKAQADSNSGARIEYSAREVSPAPLLLQQVLTAHRIFLLHHGSTISDLYVRLSQDKFSGIIDRFWTRFCRNWEVLLHGNPAVDVFGGVKLAAGGELGVGVGEEEWGSGEREVLEDLVRQTEGMIDLTVSRFGQADDGTTGGNRTQLESAAALPWLGSGQMPEASDGLVFGGSGAITRASLRDISAWVEQIYTYGEHAYGVKDNPHRQRRKRRRPQPSSQPDVAVTPPPGDQSEPKPDDHDIDPINQQIDSHPSIPPPIITAVEESLNAAARAASPRESGHDDKRASSSGFGMSNKWMKYLTLGLSTYAIPEDTSPSPSTDRPQAPRRTSSSSSTTIRPSTSKPGLPHSKEPDIQEEQENNGPMQTLDPAPDGHELSARLSQQKHLENNGHFVIGFMGSLDNIGTEGGLDSASDEDGGERKMIRTVQVELRSTQNQTSRAEDIQSDHSDESEKSNRSDFQRLRVLVYVHRPFIYTFLFEQRTPTLTITSFYSKLHKHLRPLYRPLLRSTSPQNVAQRIADANALSPPSSSTDNASSASPRSSPVFDLVFDPLTLTIHTSLPNIPDPGTFAAEGITTSSTGRIEPPAWTRLEAINVHSQILNTLMATSGDLNTYETERTSKTSRGWWVVWLRIPPAPNPEAANSGNAIDQGRTDFQDCRVAFLVRKANDPASRLNRNSGMSIGGAGSYYGHRVTSSVSDMFGFGRSGGSGGNSRVTSSDEGREDNPAAGAGWGLGIDARKYVEGLLSLNR